MAEVGDNNERGPIFETPRNKLTVQLPRVIEDETDREVLLGMHTDMLGMFDRALRSLRTETTQKLLVQGRVLTSNQFFELQMSPVWRFFWEARQYRVSREGQEKVLKFILPKETTLTDKDIQTYAKMQFSPSTLSEEIGFKVGWYPASSLLDKVWYGGGSNALKDTLGGCNEFEIGSNSLSLPILNMVRFRIRGSLEKDTTGGIGQKGRVVTPLPEKLLRNISKIYEFKI